MPRYAISDIHGCCQTFRFMVEEELEVGPGDALFLLGDYIDRGPYSRNVIDYILDLQGQGYQVRTLRGNHEAMMLQAWEDETLLPWWYRNGGDKTLESFGVKALRQIPKKYRTFFEQLEYYAELPDYLLVHAGFEFTPAGPFENLEAMLWIRQFEVDHAFLGSRKIVHGHTPTPFTQIQQQVDLPGVQVINIDGGCVYKHQPDLGHLTALNLDTLHLHVIPNQD